MIHVVKPPFALSSPDDNCRHPEAETQQRVRRGGGVTKALLSRDTRPFLFLTRAVSSHPFYYYYYRLSVAELFRL